jgi:fumarate hydratase subunit beta
MIKVTTPLTVEQTTKLKSGDNVLITGYIYTARDAAHARLVKLLEEGKELPFNVDGQIIYYVGPTPAKPGQVIGSAGPTTSYRMDAYAPALMDVGLKGMIGKGKRDAGVKDAILRNKAIYFAATGGAAALIAKTIKSSEIVAYEDLGAEAIRKLYVEDFPAVVINDTEGGDLYIEGQAKWNRE